MTSGWTWWVSWEEAGSYILMMTFDPCPNFLLVIRQRLIPNHIKRVPILIPPCTLEEEGFPHTSKQISNTNCAVCSVTQSCRLFATAWTIARLLCPLDFPGKNTGVGCHSLLQGIFLTQGSNPGPLYHKHILYSQPPGKLITNQVSWNSTQLTPSIWRENQNQILPHCKVCHTASGFFTIWDTTEAHALDYWLIKKNVPG